MNQNCFINEESGLADSLTAHSVGRIWGTPQQLRQTYPSRKAIRVKLWCGLCCNLTSDENRSNFFQSSLHLFRDERSFAVPAGLYITQTD
jgi:hypothetical protein